MKILYITNHLNIGGITSYILTLAQGLSRRGHKIYLASSAGGLLYKFNEVGIEFIRIPIKTKKEIGIKVFMSALKLSRFIKENKIDIIHTNSRTTQVLGAILHGTTKVSHISTCHGFFKKRFLRRVFPCWGEKVIAISKEVKEHLISDFNICEEDIAVINNGIDISRFADLPAAKTRPQIKNELGLMEGPVIGIIARLSDVKGHKYLIKAMKLVLEKHVAAQLLIVGEGKMYAELKELAQGLNIAESVKFISEISDTKDALSVMDIFVMPSLQEGLGLALMEAMASGIAVVGSDIGGIKTLIQDGVNGLLVERADPPALAKAIVGLLEDPLKRKALGDEARRFVAANFSQEKMVLSTEEEYVKCLSQKG
jgi:glycosyltransferase involved in cell wall biosynthesis